MEIAGAIVALVPPIPASIGTDSMAMHLKATRLKKIATAAIESTRIPERNYRRGDQRRQALAKIDPTGVDLSEAKQYINTAEKQENEEREAEENTMRKLRSLAPSDNPLGKPWPMQQNGDLWQSFWHGLVERGPDSVKTKWVKGHAKQVHIDAGITNERWKRGNDHGDTAANRGVKEVGEEVVQIADWMQKKHSKYTGFMDRVHVFQVKLMEKIKAKRDEKKALLKATQNKTCVGKVHICECLPYPKPAEAYRLQCRPLPKGPHKFHQQRNEMEKIRKFVASIRWAPEIETGIACTWLELDAGFCCQQGKLTLATKLAQKPLLDQQLRLFKQKVRHIALMTMNIDREGMFTGTVTRCTRLQAIGVTNYHGSFAAAPAWSNHQAKAIAIMLLQQKGNLSPKSTMLLSQGRLWLSPSRMRFKGAAAWQINPHWEGTTHATVTTASNHHHNNNVQTTSTTASSQSTVSEMPGGKRQRIDKPPETPVASEPSGHPGESNSIQNTHEASSSTGTTPSGNYSVLLNRRGFSSTDWDPQTNFATEPDNSPPVSAPDPSLGENLGGG